MPGSERGGDEAPKLPDDSVSTLKEPDGDSEVTTEAKSVAGGPRQQRVPPASGQVRGRGLAPELSPRLRHSGDLVWPTGTLCSHPPFSFCPVLPAR